MELSSSWEGASRLATEEFTTIFWNPEVHYRVHKSPPLVPILSQMESIPPHIISQISILILLSHLCLGLPSCLFPSGFPHQNMHSSSLFVLHAMSILSPLTDHCNYISRRIEVIKLLIMQFSRNSYFIFLRSRNSPQHPVLKYPQSFALPLKSETKFHIHTKVKANL
jgi:hypothetical protein